MRISKTSFTLINYLLYKQLKDVHLNKWERFSRLYKSIMLQCGNMAYLLRNCPSQDVRQPPWTPRRS